MRTIGRTTVFAMALVGCGPTVGNMASEAEHTDETESAAHDASVDGGVGSSSEPGGDEAHGGDATSSSGLGAACEHGWFGMNANLSTYPHAGCDGDICIFAVDMWPPTGDCSADVDCGPHHQCAAREDGSRRCALKLSYVLERSMCSQVCDVDDDCIAEGDTSCEQGFTCSYFSSLGPLCCQRVCVCRDDLGSMEALERDCEAGTVPGC